MSFFILISILQKKKIGVNAYSQKKPTSRLKASLDMRPRYLSLERREGSLDRLNPLLLLLQGHDRLKGMVHEAGDRFKVGRPSAELELASGIPSAHDVLHWHVLHCRERLTKPSSGENAPLFTSGILQDLLYAVVNHLNCISTTFSLNWEGNIGRRI